MKIHEFLKSLSIENSEDKRVVDSHPMQWICGDVNIPVWEVKYSYVTNNKHKKDRIKYIFKEFVSDGEVEHYFMNHIDEYNEKHPYRAISNVEILEINYIDGLKLYLE